MIATSEKEGLYLASFRELEDRLAANSPSWLHEIRRAAIAGFAEKGFPTTRQEEWRNTNVAPIAAVPFQLATTPLPPPQGGGELRILQHPLADLGCPKLVFINGRFAKQLSTLGGLPAEVKAGSLGEALESEGKTLERHLARYAADYREHAFVALNTAFLEDGAFIEIPRGVVLEKPIYLLYVSDPNGLPTVSYPRNLIIAGRESQASIVEAYVCGSTGTLAGANVDDSEKATGKSAGPTEAVYFTNAVSEVAVGEGAVLEYHRLQQESDRAFHFGRLVFHQERSSNVATHSIATGGRLVREEVNAVLDGEGAEAMLAGLYVITGRQHIDNQTTLDHAQPHCSSREVYKGVLDGESSAVFNGKIIVRKDAQKTDSKQSNKNLLLSEKAVIDTKPALEIYADDVKCTHGATIGQIDADAVFYLRSRGIGLQEARDLLTYAFVNDILGRIKYQPLRERLSEGLSARLASGQRAEEAVES
ncbi:MAG: Fe-S cluster assembly protein SufD [Terriglobia bacterium]|jgi:Fe-S cluster assembly protein SufD